jgi:predicted permease
MTENRRRSLEGIWMDLRYTLRTLIRDRGFATFAILIVGLGIGASATVFSVIDRLFLRPLPFREPERLVWIANHDVSGLSGQTTQVHYLLDLRQRASSFESVGGYFAFYGVGDNLLSGAGDPERLTSVPVSENFFQVLGVQPQVGRLFTPEECRYHGAPAALLSHAFWQRRFNGDPSIVGRAITLDSRAVTVAGVLPASFDLATLISPGSRFDLYVPFPLTPETDRQGNTLAIIGRLKPGVGVGQARAELKILAPQLVAAHPNGNDFAGVLTPLTERVNGRVRPALFVLACGVGVVMLIVCANLSNLLLARTAGRQKEIAIRTAMGAGRWRLIRQMLTEGVTLSCTGALFGIALATAAMYSLSHIQALSIPMLTTVRMDTTVLAFCLLAAVVTGVLFGLAPALQAPMGSVHGILKDSSRGSTAGRSRGWIRGALVVSEIAFACILLVAAGLLGRSFLRVLDVQLGFHPENTITMRVDPGYRLSTREQGIGYIDEVLRRVREVPGVTAAGLTDSLPLGSNRSWGAPAKGQVYERGKFPVAFVRVVSDDYLKALGISLTAGRDLSPRDVQGTQPVIVINQTMANTLWPGQNPIGQSMRACGERQVVGVIGDVRHLGFEQSSGMEMYLPMRQCQDISSLSMAVRTSLPPDQAASAVRAALLPVIPNLPRDFRTVQQLVDKSVSPRRFVVALLSAFAVFALVLASLGIYGVISYNVAQRTQEIGIRMALGAPAGKLQAGIVGKTLALAGIGIAIGTVVSRLLTRAISGMLFGVTENDTATFAGMVLILATVAALAGYIPSRRAAQIDPAIALRAE